MVTRETEHAISSHAKKKGGGAPHHRPRFVPANVLPPKGASYRKAGSSLRFPAYPTTSRSRPSLTPRPAPPTFARLPKRARFGGQAPLLDLVAGKGFFGLDEIFHFSFELQLLRRRRRRWWRLVRRDPHVAVELEARARRDQ